MINHHASCVAFANFGVLIRGASGSGKSTLALQLIDSDGFGLGQKRLRAKLVADDQVILQKRANKLVAKPPTALVGLIEVRGVGILAAAVKKSVTVKLIVDLAALASVNRLPELADLKTELEGVVLPRIAITQHNPAAAAILRAVLHSMM